MMRRDFSHLSRRSYFGLAVSGVAAMAIILLIHREPPLLGDYVEWVYHGVLLRDLLQGHPNDLYLLKNYPVPNSLTTVGLAILMLLVPWKIAAKLWLVIGMFLGLFCAYRLNQASGNREPWQLIVVTAAVLLGIDFWWGFINFLFGVYLVMLFCSFLLRGEKSRWIYAVLLTLIFFSHMIPLAYALCVFGLYVLQTKRWQLAWQTIPAIVLCAWYFIARFMHGDIDGAGGMEASVPYASPWFVVYKINTYLKCWGFVNPASTFKDSILLRLVGPVLFSVLLALNLIIGVTIFISIVRAVKQVLIEKKFQTFFWLATSLFFVVGLLMPGAAAGISDPGGRMLQTAIWCAVCIIATRQTWANALSLCATVLIGFSLYQLVAVGEKSPMQGTVAGPLPARMREFGHVFYSDRSRDYAIIERGQMNIDIYPTAMFLKKPSK